jgi:hypothetical protein
MQVPFRMSCSDAGFTGRADVLAAVKGRADAVRMRREIAELMSETEIATAQREARDWMMAH